MSKGDTKEFIDKLKINLKMRTNENDILAELVNEKEKTIERLRDEN